MWWMIAGAALAAEGAEDRTIRLEDLAAEGEVRDQFREMGTHAVRLPAVERRAVGFTVKVPEAVTPAIHDGVLVAAADNRVYGVDARSGEPQWARQLDDPGVTEPACDDGICVVNTYSCTLFALETRTGRPLWSAWLAESLNSTPAIAQGVVYTSFPATSGSPPALVAFDLRDGGVRWQRVLDGEVAGAPTVVDGEVVARTFAGTLVRIDADTGALFEAVAVGESGQPVVWGSDVLLAKPEGFDEPLLGLGTFGLLGLGWGATTSPVMPDRAVPVGDSIVRKEGEHLSAQGPDGERWRVAVPHMTGSPIAAGGWVLVGAGTGVEVVDATAGRRVKAYDVGAVRGEPILDDGWMYVATSNRGVVALDTEDDSLTGWTQWSRDAARSGG